MRKFVGVQITRIIIIHASTREIRMRYRYAATFSKTVNTRASYVVRYIEFLANQDHILAFRVTSTASTVLETGRKSGRGKPCSLAIGLFAWFSRHNF